MRIVVVGAGVVGLISAIECVRRGARVDLVEQAAIPSRTAASYDRQRVVRTLHRGDPVLTRAATRLVQDWSVLERMLGTRILVPSGVLTVLPEDRIDAESAALTGAGVPVDVLPARRLAARYPRVRFGAGRGAILEMAAGTVLADRALLAAAAWLRRHPLARLLPHRRVDRIAADGVRLSDGSRLDADRVIVAAGPWSGELLVRSLAARLTVRRQTVLDYAGGRLGKGGGAYPVMLGLGARSDAWLIPSVAGAPARLSAASACRGVASQTDDDRPEPWVGRLVDEFAGLLADFDPQAVSGAAEGHYLTASGSDGPLLAELGDGRVWAYAACAGMSFKFAPVVAGALADRVLGRPARATGLASVDRPSRFGIDDESPG